MNKSEQYRINVEVRDINGKIIQDFEGNNRPSFSFDLTTDPIHMESHLTQLTITLKAYMPDRKINISASVLNTISNTYMVMYSYYGSENRFIKHS
jgi:hypothetical protein